ncbi:oligopeptide/dipeptide ABC transporter ATP-binding protein [Paenactinomyces guangxiensis]|uniref:oligopeptide/dipeptide ABC transporter ATP-binding protein n=1 Tax=Paenactinomyces guangxiensis TaxID=1490290 RepID=UPI001E4EE9D3|nr:oligopeptide/dipeptide ABC transporter ATP-binding protein [Paenactinomyces guangxiensis]
MTTIGGEVPNLHERPPGCPFAPRCSKVMDRCVSERPPLEPRSPGHHAACWAGRETT